jgi:hypothetical protein
MGRRRQVCRLMLVLLRHLHWAKELVQRRQPGPRIRLADPHGAGRAIKAQHADGSCALIGVRKMLFYGHYCL